jgi:hypothetical protein
MMGQHGGGGSGNNRGMGHRNEAVAVASRDASRTDFPCLFALQAAHASVLLGGESNILNMRIEPA